MKRSVPTGAWIAGGLVAAALVIPGASYAAATLTEIVGSNGTTAANVSKGHQLLTAEAMPSNFFTETASVADSESTACQDIGGPPLGHGAVLRDVRYTVYDGDGSLDTAMLFIGSCAAVPFAQIGLDRGNGELTLNPGISVPSGASIYLQLQNYSEATDDVSVDVDGYTVPASDVSAVSQIQGKG